MKTTNEKAIYAAIGIVAIVAAYWAGTQQSAPVTDSSPQQKQAEIKRAPEKTVSNTPLPSPDISSICRYWHEEKAGTRNRMIPAPNAPISG